MTEAPKAAPQRAFLDIVSIDSIVIGERFRKQFDDIPALAASIEAIGLLQPAGVTADNQLVFGHRRLLALKHLGRTTVAVKRVASLNALQSEFDENECRANFTLSERVAIAEALRPAIEAAAKERELSGVTASNPEEKILRVRAPQSRDEVAAAVGLSAPKLAKAAAVVAAAKADPVKFGPIAERMDASDNASAAYAAISPAPAKPAPRALTLADVMAALPSFDYVDRMAIVDEVGRLNGLAKEIAA